jgi:transcriptional antiterminator RfaH
MLRWYAIQTHANAETKAALNLVRQGLYVYYPRHLKRRRHARRTESVVRAVFPGYVFVRIDIQTSRWRAIESTYGVRRLISFGDRPTPVPVGVIESLRDRENGNGLVILGRAAEFNPGQPVEITIGPFAEYLARFEALDDKERVTLLLDLMGRQVRVRVPLEAVRPLH